MNKDISLVGLIILLGVVLLVIFFIGPSNPDEFLYLFISNKIDTNGIGEYFSLAGTSLRYLKVVYNILVSLPIVLFGYSLVAYSAISLISYLLISVLIYFFTKKCYKSRIQAFLASLLFLSIPASIFYASLVLPEMIHALFIFTSVFLLILAVKSENKNGLFLFLTGIFWGLSLYLREHSVFIFPVYIYFTVKYWPRLKLKFFYIALGYALTFLVINGIVFLNSGDFLFQWTFTKLRFGGVDPEKTTFFETIGPRLFYTTALFTRIDYFGTTVLGITGLFIYKVILSKGKPRILFDDIFYIILLLFVSYEVLYRIILPVPRTVAYISPIFPFLAIYLSKLIVSVKTSEISFKMVIMGFLTILIVSLILLFAFKNTLVHELAGRLSARDTYLVDSGPRAILFFKLIVISVINLTLIYVVAFFVHYSIDAKLQLVIFFTMFIPSILILSPFRTQKSIDFVRVNKTLTSYIQKSETGSFYIHDSYQRSPLICYSGYSIEDGYINEKRSKNKQHVILPLDSITNLSGGLIIIDKMILEQKMKIGITDLPYKHIIDSIQKHLQPVYSIQKISVYPYYPE